MQQRQKRRLLSKTKHKITLRKYTCKHHYGRTAEEIIENCQIAREAQSKKRIKHYKELVGKTYGNYKFIKVLDTDKSKRLTGLFLCLGCNKKYKRRISQIIAIKPCGCKSCAGFIREKVKREEV